MRVTQLLALSGFMLASNVAVAAKLDRDDVPDNCWKVCGPVVGWANKCDGMHDDDDRAELKCICDWNQGRTLVPLCEGCIAEYRSSNGTNDREDNDRDDDDDDDRNDRDDNDRNEPHDNDAYDILTSCSWSTTSYNPSAATSALSSTGTSPSTADATATGTGTSSGSDASTTTGSGSNAETTDNAAAGTVAPKAATLAAVMGLGFLAWL